MGSAGRAAHTQTWWLEWATHRKAEAQRLERAYIRQADRMAEVVATYGCDRCDALIEFRMDGDTPTFKNPSVTHDLLCPLN